MKKLLLSVFVLFSFSRGYAAYLENVPQTLQQPDGTVLHCFASGDEFYNWLHDALGYTIVKDPQTGYYVYALPAAEGQIAPSQYVVGVADPVVLGLPVSVRVSNEIIMARRAAFEETITKDRPQKAGGNTGTINNIVIFIRFSDESSFSTSKNFNFMDQMFNDTSSLNAISLQNFYKLISYGQLQIVSHLYPAPSGTVILSYQDIHPRSYYKQYSASNPGGYDESNGVNGRTLREHTLLANAVNEVASSIPYSLNLDNNNDGYVDNVCFMISGSPEGWSNLLWPHRWTLFSNTNVRINGKTVRDYNLNLADANGSSSCASTICHEMFHTLSAPDLYRSDANLGTPVGTWDLMASTNPNIPQGMDAYLKFKYGGWIQMPEITKAGTYTLYPLNTNTMDYDPNKPVGYMIKLPDNSNEYLVLEYRKTNACIFESTLPGSGLLIYRINKTITRGNIDATGNDPYYDEVYLFRPGGRKLTSSSANGDLSRAHFSSNVGRTIFSSETSAYPFYCDGNKEESLVIYNVTTAGDSIQFSYRSYTLEMSRDKVNLDYQADNLDTITIESDMPWTITGIDNSWLKVTPSSGSSGKTVVQFSTRTQNSIYIEKICNLKVNYEDREKEITVTQKAPLIDSCQAISNHYPEDTLMGYNFQQYSISSVAEYFAKTDVARVIDSVAFYFGDIKLNAAGNDSIRLNVNQSNSSNYPGTTLSFQIVFLKNLKPNAWNTIVLEKTISTDKGITVGYSFNNMDSNMLRINIYKNAQLRIGEYNGTMMVKKQGGSWQNPSETTYSELGNYSLAVKLFACPKDLDIKQPTAMSELSLYPNPATSQLFINHGNMPIQTVAIYDMVGRLLKSENVNLKSQTAIDISNLQAGLYVVKVTSATGVQVRKLVISD